MSPIQRVLKRAAVRLAFQRLLSSLVLTITLAGAVLLVMRIFERGGIFAPNWQMAMIIAGSAAFVASLAWVLFRLPSREGTARIVDDAAGLKESLSTALAVESSADAWSRAAVADAVRKSRDISVSRTFPWTAPRRWPAPIVAIALFLIAGFLPSFDLLGDAAASEDERQSVRQIEAAIAEVKGIESKVSETLKELGLEDTLDEFDAQADLKPENPEDVRRLALAKLTSVQDRLSQIREQKDGGSLDALRERLRDLKQGSKGPLEEFSRAMQKGDFQGAKAALEDLKQRMNDGSLSQEQKKQLADQFKSLSEQLSQIANDRKDLERKLAEAGLDPSLAAADPEALRRALEKAKNLTEAQKQAIKKMASECNSSSAQCNSMAAMAASMGESGSSLSSAEMQAMNAKLGELSDAQSSLEQMDRAMAEFKEQMDSLCQSMGQCEGDRYDPFARPKPGVRGVGAGNPFQQRAEFDTKQEKSTTRGQAGPIIGSTFVQGGQIRGEATQSFADAVRQSGQVAAEAIDENLIPAEYHDAVKHYFGRLDDAAKSASKSNGTEQ